MIPEWIFSSAKVFRNDIRHGKYLKLVVVTQRRFLRVIEDERILEEGEEKVVFGED